MTVILFEDSRVAGLFPFTLARPAFAVSCGGARLLDQVAKLGLPLRACVRPHLVATTLADGSWAAVTGISQNLPLHDLQGPVLWVNARLVPSVVARRELAHLWEAGDSALVLTGSDVAAALWRPDGPTPKMAATTDLAAWLAGLSLPRREVHLPLLEYPHTVLAHHAATLRENLEQQVAEGDYREVAEGVFADPGTTWPAGLATDTRQGPIVLEARVSFGPFCYLRGPLLIGEGVTVREHASLKDGVTLGKGAKVGGEIEGSIIEPFSNKQHYGFLGHSILGSWVNLGAGTSTSDLKNTYGTIKVHYGATRLDTGMQFVGAFIGDYSKTAINSGLFAGKTIGVGSLLYGLVTANVPSFVNYAREFGQVTGVSAEVLIATQERMFTRRGLVQRPCDIQLLRDLHALTAPDREAENIAMRPLSF